MTKYLENEILVTQIFIINHVTVVVNVTSKFDRILFLKFTEGDILNNYCII